MPTVLLLEDLQTARQEARFLPLSSRVLVGCGVDAAVRLHDASVARLHARLTITDDGTVWTEDLGSRGGTWLGGRPVLPGKPERWSEGERLHVGPRFVLLLSRSPSDEARATSLSTWTMGDEIPPLDDGQPLSPWAEQALREAQAADDPFPADASAAAATIVAPDAPLPLFQRTLALDPTVLAAMPAPQAPTDPRRLFGATAVMAAARPEPGAGSLTFSGFTTDQRGPIAREVLREAAEESPLEAGGRRTGRRGPEARPTPMRGVKEDRVAGRGVDRRRSGRRRVIRHKRSFWPFALLGLVTLGLGAVATNLFLHGSLPWVQKRPTVDEPAAPEGEGAPNERDRQAKADGRGPGKVPPPPPPKTAAPKGPHGGSSLDAHTNPGKHRSGKRRRRHEPAGGDERPASTVAI